jgi:hypothetical protein
MKNVLYLGLILLFFLACKSSKTIAVNDKKVTPLIQSDTIRIANESLEYEVIIIDSGFNTWLNSQAKPRGFYSQKYLESRNITYVTEWNNRVLQTNRFDPRLYEIQINYSPGVDYGYDVNYLLYNYFIYFQITKKQQLAGFVPRP